MLPNRIKKNVNFSENMPNYSTDRLMFARFSTPLKATMKTQKSRDKDVRTGTSREKLTLQDFAILHERQERLKKGDSDRLFQDPSKGFEK